MQLIEFFDKGARIAPDKVYLRDDTGARTYREAERASHRIGNGLRRLGIAEGTRVAVYCPNSMAGFECLMGALRAGCVWVSANIRNAREDTAHILNNTATEVLFYSASGRGDVAYFRQHCASVAHAICVDGDGDSDGGPSLAQLVEGAADLCPAPARGRDDLVTLFNSGGTTGAPKGVMMSNLAWESLIANQRAARYLEEPVQLVAAPMTHAAGAFMLALAPMGVRNVFLRGFEPEAVMQAIQQHRVTHLFLPPTAIYRMLAHPNVRDYDYSSLRYFSYAAAPMAPEKIVEAIEVFGPVMATGFGQTESGLDVTYFGPEDHVAAIESGNLARLHSCGRETPYVRVAIMGEDGRLLPPGEPGEIVVRGNQVMMGYWNAPEESARAFRGDWLLTGDIGYQDDEGWYYLVDRKRDMIISGGFNVFPAEVEKVVIAHAAVQDCAVVGVPDPDWGEAVLAVVELKPGASVTSEELHLFCRPRLGGIKTPKRFEFSPALPRSAVGKVLRRKVREVFWQAAGRQI